MIKAGSGLFFELFFYCGFIVVPCYVYYFQRGRVYIWVRFETVKPYITSSMLIADHLTQRKYLEHFIHKFLHSTDNILIVFNFFTPSNYRHSSKQETCVLGQNLFYLATTVISDFHICFAAFKFKFS